MFDPNGFLEYAETIAQMYEQMELEILDQLRVKAKDACIQQNLDKYSAIRQHKAKIDEIINRYKKDGAEVLKDASALAYLCGAIGADTDLNIYGKNSVYNQYVTPEAINGGFGGRIRSSYVNALAQELSGNIDDMVVQCGRRVNDVYRKIVNKNIALTATGRVNREQVTQRIINDFLGDNHHIPVFRDKAGRYWDIGSYARMATRTAMVHAGVQGNIDRLKSRGKDLVIVSQHTRSCPMCQQWERKILSITGNTKGYPTVADAQAGGLWHPNCGHSMSAYIEGLTDVSAGEDQGAYIDGTYQDQQDMRKCERNIRKYKAAMASAVSDKERARYQAKIREWEAKAREIHKREGIPLNYKNRSTTKIKDTRVTGRTYTQVRKSIIEKHYKSTRTGKAMTIPNTVHAPKKADKYSSPSLINKGFKKLLDSMEQVKGRLINKSRRGEIANTLRDYMDKGNKNYRSKDLREVYYRFMQKNYMRFDEVMKEKGAYYNRETKRVSINLEGYGSMKTKTGLYNTQFSTFFHEFGHMIDNRVASMQRGGNTKFTDANDPWGKQFRDAISADFKNLTSQHSTEWIEKNVVRNLKWNFEQDGDKYYDMSVTNGIQDLLRGLSDGKIKTSWGHDLKYYKRTGDPMNDVASETWANMCADLMSSDTRPWEAWQEFFPSTVDMFYKKLDELIELEIPENDRP